MFIILGDFNQPNIEWHAAVDGDYLNPSNLHDVTKTSFCDNLTACNFKAV